MASTQVALAVIIGIILFVGGFFGGFIIQNYLNTRSLLANNPTTTSEDLTIESHILKIFSKLAIQLNLRNTGTTNIQVTDVKMNGYSNQSVPGMNQGWNGTTFLNPNQLGQLYVYLPCYFYAINGSMPTLSTPLTQTELENLESWMSTYNCTLTIFTNTAHQYTYTIPDLVWFYAFAGWMGSLTYTFMATEQLQITNLQFGGFGVNRYMAITTRNTGTSQVTINEAWINNVKQTAITPTLPQTIGPNVGIVLNVTYSWIEGNNYQIKLISSKGNQFLYTAVAPES